MTDKKSILVMDDDTLVLTTLTRVLEKAGYAVRAFQKAKDAFQEALMEDFDLIITDIRMPEIDGIQAIRYIREVRQEKGKSQPPEIFITGYAKDYEDSAKNLNPHAFIHKPFNLPEFLDVVRQALE